MPPRLLVNDALWRNARCGYFPLAFLVNTTKAGTHLRWPNNTRPSRPGPDATCRLRTYTTSTPSTVHSSSRSGPLSGKQSRRARNHVPLAQRQRHVLHEQLRHEGQQGRFDEVLNICRVLVKDRGEQPNKEMYNAVLHSFVSATNGTAGKVRRVLEEMGFWHTAQDAPSRDVRIELDARGCHCVLEVLAVHPDYLLRTEILEYMKSRWFTLSDRGHHFVIAGLLRERHFEQALEGLEQMVQKKVRIEEWLFDLALWTLLEFGEVEEAFYILSLQDGARRQGNIMNVTKPSSALYMSLLDAAARKQLYDNVKMVWNSHVQPGYLKPGTGTCLNVLALASRHGDVHLATDVFRILTERGNVFTSHHYELLITTYLNANDLSAALSVVLIMVDANLKVDAGTCQPLYWYLSKVSEGEDIKTMAAFGMLQDLEASGRKVPTAAINACLQASISLKRFEEAIEFYKALHTVSQSGPDTQTFNILFRGCYLNRRKELAMFLANEMIQLGLKPDRLTYDRLILVCLQAGDVEDAFLYYEEMRTVKVGPTSHKTFKPRRGTWEDLIRSLVTKGDDRAVAVLRHYQQDTPEPRKGVETAVRSLFEANRIIPKTSSAPANSEDEGRITSEELKKTEVSDN